MAQLEKKCVGVWIRVSTEDQANGESPANHQQRARFYAEAKGWEVVEVYDLSGVSGKSVSDHPEAKRMMADVTSGAISGLIFSKLARLARNTRELLDFAEFFREHGADLISLQEAIDTSSPAGRLFYTMIAAMAQWEREEIAERVAAAVPVRAKLGKPIGGQPCFGYHWLDGKLVPHPDEAPVRKLVYELFLEHKRKKTVARVLNERGYRTRKGAKFSDTTITRLLRDPTAKGVHRANYTKSNGRGKAASLKPEGEWVLRPVEPIVSEDLWSQCNTIMDQQRAGRPARRKTAALFSGYAICECGNKMYPRAPSPKYICGECRNKIPIDDLEALFQEQLKSFFFSDDQLEAFLADSDEDIVKKQDELDALGREHRKVAAEQEKVYRSYIDDELTTKKFGALYNPLDDRKEAIEQRQAQLQAEIDILKINRLSSEEIISGARDLYSRWYDLPFEEKRSIVDAITENIVIGKEEIEINLHHIPSENDGKKATRPHGFIAAIS
ncbi:MAG: recombinase family protein [Euryhalocaulis sp.]|uniref:recombinase family protein n=1 Tax=Euryhalocaulis sp. TaxID=2744307 RepID=UPI0017ECEC1C|nr:recombinase family protein [Euryhalocaulis sp.]MBA4802984.1 recombinase family protein [Euryhalocaulis sp.]